MHQGDQGNILRYRISPSLLNLARVADVSDALVSIFANSSCTCILNCDEQQYSGTTEQFRQQIPMVAEETIHSFSLNITVPPIQQTQYFQQAQQQFQQAQQQLQLLQQQQATAQPPQRSQIRQQIQQQTQLQQQLQQQITRLQQTSPAVFTLNLDWIGEIATFSISGQSLTVARQYLPTEIDEAAKVIRSRIATSEPASAAVLQGGKLLDAANTIGEKLPHAQKVIEQALTLVPSVHEAIKRATDARLSAENAESEAAQLRRNAESERSKINDLREGVIQTKADLSQMLASAKESHAQMLAFNKESHAQMLASSRENHAHALSTAQANFAQSKKQLTDLSTQATALVEKLQADEISTSKLTAQAKELVQKLEQESQDAATQVKSKLVEWDSKFKEMLDECAKKRDQIHQLLGAAVAANLSTTFKERQVALEKGRGSWLLGIFVITTAIAGVSFWIVDSTLNSAHASAGLAWVLRIFVVLPLVLLDAFCISQYKRKMLLADQYAFKASIAASFDYYRDEIRIGFREGQGMAEFITQAVGRLWAEPNHTTELSTAQIRRLTKMLETLGVHAIKEGSAVTQAALNSRGVMPAASPIVRDGSEATPPSTGRSNEATGPRN